MGVARKILRSNNYSQIMKGHDMSCPFISRLIKSYRHTAPDYAQNQTAYVGAIREPHLRKHPILTQLAIAVHTSGSRMLSYPGTKRRWYVRSA